MKKKTTDDPKEKTTISLILKAREANTNALLSLRNELKGIRNDIAVKEFRPHERANELRVLKEQQEYLESIENLLSIAARNIKEAADIYQN